MPRFGFETSAWTLSGSTGHASIQSDEVYSGKFALSLKVTGGASPQTGTADSPVFPVYEAGTHHIDVWVKVSDNTRSDVALEGEHWRVGYPFFLRFPMFTDVKASDLAAGWNLVSSDFPFTGLASTDNQIRFETTYTGSSPHNETPVTFYVDDAHYSGPLAIKLAERAVTSITSLLQANLATELTAIDTDRADGITMAAPASGDYYNHDRPEIAGATSHVEVIAGPIEFSDNYSDSAHGRAVYDVPIVVRLTWFNRDGDTRSTMELRKFRYASGIFLVFNKNAGLADSDDATQISRITNVEGDITVPETNTFKGQVTLTAVVRCEEVQ